ncbi:MAG: class I SAM-dependent methyltransferase, partial [Duncaniella sp.]|nr:class I SAM-dependent methyltransferase [Duncaniella sp.]
MATDYARLRLKYHGDPAKMHEILQAECREKTLRKLPTLSVREEFIFPSLAVAEMSTSEDVAELHAAMVPEGSQVVDMTAGLGVDAFAIARRGCRVTAWEIDPVTASALLHNTELLDLDIEVRKGDSLGWLDADGSHVDAIFIDPARRDTKGRHYALKDCHPDVTAIMPKLLARADRVIVKTSPMVNLDELASFGAEIVVIG